MILPVQVTFDNIAADAALEAEVRELAARLERYYSPITSCRVLVEMLGRHIHGNLYHVRIDLGLPGGEIVVETEPDLHAGLQDTREDRIRKSGEVSRLHRSPKRAILDAFGEMRRRLQDYARKQRGDVKRRAEPLVRGSVNQLHPAEGYGFILTPDDRQVYFHRDAVLGGRFNVLRDGAAVRFCEEAGEQGPQATTVKLVHPRKQARAAAAVVPMRQTGRIA